MNELELFSEQEKTMTVKEIAQAFNCDERTIQLRVKSMFPENVQNGKQTRLNEKQVTALKLSLQQNAHLESAFELPKSDLEKELLIAQAMQFQQEKILKMQELLLIQAPKVEQFDKLMKTESMMSLTDACKHFGIKPRKNGIPSLQLNGYLTSKQLPTQRAIDIDIMSLKETIGNDNYAHRQAVVSTNQLPKFGKVIERIAKEIE